MKKHFLALGLLAALPALVSHAKSGGWTSSGGDSHSIEFATAWFLGTAPIGVCTEIAPGFGKSKEEVKEVFLEANGIWKDYVSAKRIGGTLGGTNQNLNFNFQFMAGCDGSEDLKLYFGADSPEVAGVKARYENPFAFAERKSYDLKTGRGKGFIWFAQTNSVYPRAGEGFPNWTKPKTLLGMMLHELGHVFGCGHVAGTIMREDMMSALQLMDAPNFSKRGAALLSRIDDTQLLYHSEYAPFHYDGTINLSSGENDPREAATFEHVMGRRPVGAIKARYFRMGADLPRNLELSDAAGRETFLIQTVPNSKSSYTGDTKVFATARGTGEDSGTVARGGSYTKNGFTQLGWIAGKGRTKKISILISENMDDLSRPFYLRYFLDGEVKDLFHSRLPGME